MATKEGVCEIFVAVIYKDAVEVGQEIVRQLQEREPCLSLQNEVCRDVFTVERLFARLVWLQVKAESIVDPELMGLFLKELDAAITGLSHYVPDLAGQEANYYVMATMFEKGERDSLGIDLWPRPLYRTSVPETCALDQATIRS